MATASERGRAAVAARWRRRDRTEQPASAGIDYRQPPGRRGERVAARHRPKAGESFADWFYADPRRVFLDEPYAALRDVPRGCAVCEASVAKPATLCREHRRGRTA